ncbi:MAG: anaerobic ribonucleoside-triphosphate reductase activating protein [Burkholderiales bacterium]|nr:anaerobic ribonucleoside-triphosphate reductase activating protein [Burkholderiales bacterium]
MLTETRPAPGRESSGAGAEHLRIGGLTPLTSIDFPGRLAAVLFCQGCPWRCTYCHNPELLDANAAATMSWAHVQDFLNRRRGLLDGVVFSGGEPTLQAALPAALAAVRSLGFETALHTGGMYPQRLAKLLPLLDWVGLDIKAPLHRHDAITGAPGSGSKVRESLGHLLDSGVAHECRTTWHPGLFDVAELLALADELCALGVRRWALQECRTSGGAPWALTSGQTESLSARFAYFTLRRA